MFRFWTGAFGEHLFRLRKCPLETKPVIKGVVRKGAHHSLGYHPTSKKGQDIQTTGNNIVTAIANQKAVEGQILLMTPQPLKGRKKRWRGSYVIDGRRVPGRQAGIPGPIAHEIRALKDATAKKNMQQ
ncbi:hypothetical protein CDAR_95811 [Caerostris darwini]|uniref:Ribosomal protein L2 n=1 Tax=Caerostris darwini TaxID=1538125 RepID=A0AAV4UQ87_9ARAC|nr:hypothetical protein CDAR_95811 [Caerostris darwini]